MKHSSDAGKLSVFWEDGELALMRRSGDGDSPPLLAKRAVSTQPAARVVARLEHYLELRDELDPSWAVMPVALVSHESRPTLLLDDPGGELLALGMAEPWPSERFLRVALAVVTAVRQLHARGIVHKALRPSNILFDRERGRAWLLGFGIASRLTRERTSPKAPEEIEGSLAYIAPEQTGRMNRQVDSRSDLYALGVTFYELLTGRLPFIALAPMEWIHSHIARPPAKLPPSVPEPLAGIVLKLLAKTADDRYQTAAGLEADLQRCLADHRRTGSVEPFPIGQRDASDLLLIPERLYGRGVATRRLSSAFRRVAEGRSELVVVSGYSGIGKSVLVDELHQELLAKRGWLIRGKFDQYKRDIPYATLVEALQELVTRVLRESDAELSRFRAALREAAGSTGQLLVSLIPELELLIGQQQPVPEASPEEAKRRFQSLLQRMIGVLARAEHPLVLFLDDLQWADRATLDALPVVLGGATRHLLVIAAYRDNEVEADHPLLRAIAETRQLGVPTDEILLGPLDREQVTRLVADALHASTPRVEPLSRLVLEKTGGNPFFVIQFLLGLRDDGLLHFDHSSEQWCWDLPSIVARGFTDNLVDFMVGKLERLPELARQLLKQMACIGRSVPLAALAPTAGLSDSEVHEALAEAVTAGLVIRTEHGYDFPHDRVQEASYALGDEAERAAIHLRIARLLSSQELASRRDELLFELVNHYNSARRLIKSDAERKQVAELNLLAATRAKAAIAFESAAHHLAFGVEILGADAWERHPPLAFALALHEADCLYLTGALPEAVERLRALRERATSRVDRAQVTCLRAAVYLTLNQPQESIGVCLEQLREFGIDWDASPSEAVIAAEHALLMSRLPECAPELLARLPTMRDTEWRACMDVLLAMEPAAVFTDRALHDLGVMRMANLSIEHGNCDASPLGYSELSMVLPTRFGDKQSGFSFGKLGYELVERQGFMRFAGRTYLVVGYHVWPWTRPMSESLALMRRAHAISLENGDLTFTLFAREHILTLGILAGEPLEALHADAESALAYARKSRFDLLVLCQLALLTTVERLRGLPASQSIEPSMLEHPGLAIGAFFYFTRLLQLSVFEVATDAGLSAYERANAVAKGFGTFPATAEFHFYAALTLAAAGERERAAEHHAQLIAWCADAPMTFEGRAALVAAEMARVDGDALEAAKLYERAVVLSRRAEQLSTEALAHDLAARFFFGHGLTTAAESHLGGALSCYERWGAIGPLRRLDPLRRVGGRGASAVTLSAGPQDLDMATVIAMSQAVSSEIVSERLIERLMVLAVEHAGATRALLILPGSDGHYVEAEASAEVQAVKVRARHTALSGDDAAESVVRYVLRTQDTVIIDDVRVANAFSADEYLRRGPTRSLLCLPLVKQGRLVGVLYLENDLAPHVFTADRIALLRLLVSQAAISLENAQLYGALRRAELSLSEAQRLAHTGSFRWNLTTHVVSWSEETARIYGFEPNAPVTEEMVFERYHPDDREQVEQLFRSSVRETRAFDTERRLLLPDGSLKHVVIVAHVVAGESGSLEVVGAVLDVTGTKRTEEHLQASRQRYVQTLSSIGDGVIATDAAQRVAFMNPAAETLTGWSQREALERPLVDIFVVSQDGGHPTLLGRDGRHVPIEESRSPILDGGDERGVVVVFRDVTDRRRAEEAEALRHAKEAAEAANKAKDDFLANVSHEIRTPMNAILGMTELMLDAALPEDHRHWLETTKSAADSLLGIIDDLLDFSKIEAGKVELEQAPFSLRDELSDTLRALAIRAQGKGLELIGDVDPEVPDELSGDAGRLRQVLVNLVGNAIKFTNTGEVLVKIELQEPRTVDENVTLVFSVQDTGVGIPRDKQGVIFQAFAQEDTSTTRKYGGTGLGLTIAARLATLMGGSIRVESEPGVGSTFSFVARFGLRSPAVTSEPLGSGDSCQVLIVDDNSAHCRVLSRWLKGWGLRATAVGNGAAAMEVMAQAATAGRPHQLLLIDAGMPGIDGLTLARRIRERVSYRETRVVLMTSGDRGADTSGNEAWVDANLRKPLAEDELRRTIRTLLRPEAGAPVALPAAPSSPRTGESTQPLAILIAEDNEFSAQLLSELLERRGHRVTVAGTGDDAVACAVRGEFDLLLLDLHLPGIDGFEVAGRIRGRELGTAEHLPIVAVTARSREEDRLRCLGAGMDAYLTKPIRAPVLLETMQRVLRARPAAESGANLLDARVLLAACGGEQALLARIGQALRVHLPEELERAQAALARQDASGLREAAHKLYGMVAAVSTSAGALASQLEDEAERADLDASARSLTRLRHAVRGLLRALDEVSVSELQLLLD